MAKTFIQRFRESRSLFQEAINAFLRGDDYNFDSFGSSTKSGEYVTERSALKSTVVQAAVRVIGDTIASLPIITYKRLEKGKERATDNPIYKLLHDRPNPYMIPFIFKQTMQYHLLLWGNCYAEIEFKSGVPVNLWPLMPDRVEHLKTQKGEPFFKIRLPDGTSQALAFYQVFHIPGLGFDGTKGYSPLYMAREAIGLSIALQDFGSTFFLNGANIGGVIEHPGKIGDVALDNLKKSIKEQYEGISNAHRVMLLEEGMKYSKTSMPLNDAQFIEARKFQISEIARIFGLPPHMVYDLDRSTFTNIEHQGIEFVVYSLRSWLVRWEQTINWKLLYNDPKYFVEFLVDGLLRGDIASRYAAYAIGRTWGWLSANDVREFENMNPIEGGDIYLSPLNMINAKDLTEEAQKVIDSKPNPSIPEDITQASLIKAYKEERNKKSAASRLKLRGLYKGLFADTATRIIKRERIYVMREAKKAFGKRDHQMFNDFLTKFYDEQIIYTSKQLRPLVASYSQAVSEIVKDEVNFKDDLTIKLDEFINKYSTDEATGYSAEHRKDIRNLVTKSIENQTDPIEDLNSQFDDWEEKKPESMSNKEVVKVSGAVAVLTYASAGITYLIWNASPNACPICSDLDGTIVGIEQKFAEGITHEPLHNGCECTVGPA
jgi:HK97 family phage portal protein